VNKEASHYVRVFGGNKIVNLIFWFPLVYSLSHKNGKQTENIKDYKVLKEDQAVTEDQSLCAAWYDMEEYSLMQS
jgi:hypothetical protein